MNWALLTTISLILANPFNIGLSFNNNAGTTQAQFDKVEVQAQADNKSVTVTQTLGPDGGTIAVDFMGQPRKVYFPPGALVKNAEITVKVTNTVAMSYPEDAVFLDSYRPDLLNYVGPQLIMELPTDALDWQNEDILKLLIELDPGVNNGVDIKTLETAAEVRILLGNGDQDLEIMSYYTNASATLYAGDLIHSYMDGVPTTTKVSVQIVDRSPFFNYDDE